MTPLLLTIFALTSSSRIQGGFEDEQVSRGINDHKMAPEYEDPWTDEATFAPLEKKAASEVYHYWEKADQYTVNTFTAREELIRRKWLLESQKRVNTESCPSICMWCEPVRAEFYLGEGFRTFLITREKGWIDKFKFRSKKTNCGRVGFQAYYKGKYLRRHLSTEAFSNEYGLKILRDVRAEPALEHCEWLRRKKFDMRHAVECLKHSLLCKGEGEAIAIPIDEFDVDPEAVCRKASGRKGPRAPAFRLKEEPTIETFENAMDEKEVKIGKVTEKARKYCTLLLCKWGGFKKASLKLHPDRLLRMNLSDEEKAERTETFKFLVNCKDSLKTEEGEELTLNKKSEREKICADL